MYRTDTIYCVHLKSGSWLALLTFNELEIKAENCLLISIRKLKTIMVVEGFVDIVCLMLSKRLLAVWSIDGV